MCELKKLQKKKILSHIIFKTYKWAIIQRAVGLYKKRQSVHVHKEIVSQNIIKVSVM